MYAGEVGVPRLLKLFDKYKIKTTWFIPGITFMTVDNVSCLTILQDIVLRLSQNKWRRYEMLVMRCKRS